MQAHRGLVKHIERMRRLVAAARDVVAHLGQLGHQLDALGFAAAERGRGLAQREVAQAHVLEQLQRVADGRHAGKEVHGFVDFHLQHVANALAAPGHGQRLGVETRAVAGVARHLDVGQEAHLYGAQALAFTRRAAAFAGIEREPARTIAARARFERIGKQLAYGVPETDIGRGAGARRLANRRLIDFKHAINGFEAAQSRAADQRRRLARVHGFAPGKGAALADPGRDVGPEHIARQRRLARAADAGDRHQALERHMGVDFLQVVQVGAQHREPALRAAGRTFARGLGQRRVRGRAVGDQGRGGIGGDLLLGALLRRFDGFGDIGLGHRRPDHGPARLERVAHGVQQIAAGDRVLGLHHILGAALGDQAAAALAGARADVDHMVGAADRVFVMLDHDQRIALVAELVQRVEQDVVVARMQAYGRLVEHIAHALQVAAQLGREPDALGFAAAERGRATVQRQIVQAHLLEKLEPALDLGQQIARNAGLAAAQHQRLDPGAYIADRQPRDVGDAHVVEAHGARRGVQARARAAGAGDLGQVFDFLALELDFAATVVLGHQGVVIDLALVLGQLHARAHAVGAPAMLAVVREQPRIELGIAGGADRAGALRGERLQRADPGRALAAGHGRAQIANAAEHMHHALAQLQRLGQMQAQLAFIARRDFEAGHGQVDAVLLEAVQPRETRGRQELAIDAQMGVAARPRPVGELGVDALAVDHQRRQQADMLAAELRHQLGGNAVGRLRLHRRAVVYAMLGAELHIQQAQEMPDFGGGAHGGLAPAARQPLLDGDGGRNAVDRIDLGPTGGLDDGARIGIERLQIAALAFVEQDVEGQRRLARAADARDHIELAARNLDRQLLEVVLARVDDLDHVLLGLHARRLGHARVEHGRDFGDQLAAHAHRQVVLAQRLGGVRRRVLAHVFGRALGDDEATALAAFGAQVDEPVAGADHVEVVLDDDQRMAGFEQLAQRAHQLGDVVEMQARGRLVKQEQRALARNRLARLGRGLRGLGQEARELEALRLAAAERGHGLAQLHIFKADLDDGLQRAQHVAVLGEQHGGFAHREFQHIGHAQATRLQLAHRMALDMHFEDFGPVALAVAVGTAQIDIGQELHLDMLEARAAAGRAAAIAAVEAELRRRVAALARQRRHREQLADAVPGADIAGRVGARGLADRRLVDENDIAQVVRAHQAVECARGIGGLAEVAQQRRGQHVLDQRGLARAADARDGDQALQREVEIEMLQVVFACAFKHQPRRGLGHHALEAKAHLLAPAHIGTRERVGMAQVFGRAIEHDLAAARARARAHVDHAVGGKHHGRVMLDHDQRVARVAQTLHGFGDAQHVARVQAYAGLVQHEQRVDQRGAQRRRQVDALDLAAAERAALAVQRQIADADIGQVFEPGVDFGMQHLQRLRLAIRGLGLLAGRERGKELLQPRDRQPHQVMQAQARQGFELRPAPGHACGHETLGRWQHGVGAGLAAQAPQQAFGLEARAQAGGAFGVAAVLRQEHADVHLVGLAFEVFEEALDAIPGLVPLAVPLGRAVQHPGFLLGRHLGPGRVARNAFGFGVAQQVVLDFLPGRRLDGLHRAGAQRELLVRDHQAPVDTDHAAETAAGLAGADGGVEREQRGHGRGVAQAAFGAVQAQRIAPQLGLALFGQAVDRHMAAAALERDFHGFHGARALGAAQAEAVGDDIEHLDARRRGFLCLALGAFGHWRRDFDFALGLDLGETAGRQPLLDFLGRGIGRQLHGERDRQPRIARSRAALLQRRVDRFRRVMPHRQRRHLVMQVGGAREQQLQMVIELGHRADRGARVAHRVGLVDGNRRRHAFDAVHGRLVHAVEKLARVGAEGLDIAALAFGIQRVEHQARLARAAGTCDHRQFTGADIEIYVLEIVLARAADADQSLGHTGSLSEWWRTILGLDLRGPLSDKTLPRNYCVFIQ